jgi:hypothetical protein
MRALEEQANDPRTNPVRGAGATPSMGLSQFRGGKSSSSTSDSSSDSGEELHGSGFLSDLGVGSRMVGAGTKKGQMRKTSRRAYTAGAHHSAEGPSRMSEATAMGLHLGKHLHSLHGAGFFDDFKKGFNSVMGVVAPIAKVALPLIAPGIGSVASAGLGALGYGHGEKGARGKMRGGNIYGIPDEYAGAVDSLKKMDKQGIWNISWKDLLFDSDVQGLMTYLLNRTVPIGKEQFAGSDAMAILKGEHGHEIEKDAKRLLHGEYLKMVKPGQGKRTHGRGGAMYPSGAYEGQGRERDDVAMTGIKGRGSYQDMISAQQIADINAQRDINQGAMSQARLMSGGRKKRAPAGPGDGRRKRAEIVRKVMAEKGMKMIEASKYVKAHNLY